MDLDIETLQKFISTKDLITVAVIWLIVKNKVSEHFGIVEANLKEIGRNISDLKDSLLKLENKQNNRLNTISDRVTKIETKLNEEKT